MTNVPEKPSLDGIETRWIARWDADGIYRFDRQASVAIAIGGVPTVIS